MSSIPFKEGVRDADAYIWIDGSDAIAVDSNAHLIAEGAAHEDIIQSAIDNLPAVTPPYDRTRLIKLHGDFDISAQINLVEYLTVDLWGAYLKADADMNAILSHANLGTDYPRKVNILGGMIDGDKTSRTCSGIRGTFKPITLTGTNIVRCSDYGIQLISYSSTIRPKIRMVECSIGLDAGGSGNGTNGTPATGGGLFFDYNGGNQADCFITASKFINNPNAAIYMESNTSDIRITGCHFTGDSGANGQNKGIYAVSTVDGPAGTKIQIVNCHFEEFRRECIRADSVFDGEAKNNNSWTIIGNSFTDNQISAANTYSCIKSETGGGGSNDHWVVIGNVWTTIDAPNFAKYLVDIETGSNDWKVIGNQFSGGQAATAAVNVGDNDNVVQWNTDNVDAYQTQAGGAWVDPTGTPAHGTFTTVWNSNIGAYRFYTYANGGWRQVAVA